MKVVADIGIPFLEGVLEPYFEVLYIKGMEISRDSLSDADALLVRTRTRCDASLLEGTPVKFIASATIGTDHVDLKYLKDNGIAFANAPGCNAGGVMQYVHTALFSVAERKNIDLRGKTMGVIGVGNTGGRVAALAKLLGFRVLRNDPPRAAKEGEGNFHTLDYVLRNSDIITCHVPLDGTTRGMASRSFFAKMKPGAIFINASRGEVVDDAALIAAAPSAFAPSSVPAAAAPSSRLSALILDVWNGEPSAVSPELVAAADIATPHIAGYSYEGKINGTSMAVQSLARHFGIAPLFDFVPPHTPTPRPDIPQDLLLSDLPSEGYMRKQNEFARQLLSLFPIYEMDAALRRDTAFFEQLRSTYRYRREFHI